MKLLSSLAFLGYATAEIRDFDGAPRKWASGVPEDTSTDLGCDEQQLDSDLKTLATDLSTLKNQTNNAQIVSNQLWQLADQQKNSTDYVQFAANNLWQLADQQKSSTDNVQMASNQLWQLADKQENSTEYVQFAANNLWQLADRLASQEEQQTSMMAEMKSLVTKQAEQVDELKTIIASQNPQEPEYFGVLLTSIASYPGYTGSVDVSGPVVVKTAMEGRLELVYDLQGLPSGTVGTFWISNGTSCYDASLTGGNYYDLTLDPWTYQSKWVTNTNGEGLGSVTINTGFSTLRENSGKVVIVAMEDGTKIGCGVLQPLTALSTNEFATWPLYWGPMKNVKGNVVVSAVNDDLQLGYNLAGLETSTDGGMTIYQGKSCANITPLGSSLYSASLLMNPWKTGSKWTSNGMGEGSNLISVDTGYPDLATNLGRALVVESHVNAVAACAELHPLQTINANITPLKSYKGSHMITGNVTASITTTGEVALAWRLEGLEDDIYGAIEIHAGTSCDDAGADYYNSAMTKDNKNPWSNSLWVSVDNGLSTGGSTTFTGYTALTQNYNHAVVIHTYDGTPAACGELNMPLEYLSASMLAYPARDTAMGSIEVSQQQSGKLSVAWELNNLPESAGTIAITKGSTCMQGQLKGNYFEYKTPNGQSYTPTTGPWKMAKWTAMNGASSGSFEVDIGMYGLQGPLGKAIVVYDGSGKVLACGELKASDKQQAATTAAPTKAPSSPPTTKPPTNPPTHAHAMPDLSALLANNSLVSTITCAVMKKGVPDLFGHPVAFNMTYNACQAPASIHYPSIDDVKALSNGQYQITVSVNHPVQQHDHWIKWLFVTNTNGQPVNWHYNPAPATSDPAPPVTATFVVDGGQKVIPYIYCNLHGLWEGAPVNLA